MKNYPRRWLLIPDCHHPFEDQRAWRLLLRVAKKFPFHGVVVLGDFADFYSVSAHDKDPNRRVSLREEIEYCKERRAELDVIGFRRKIVTLGNHEYRLERYVQKNAPELFDLIGSDGLMDFRANGWEVTKYKDFARIGKLHVTHETGGAGKYEFVRVGATFEGSVAIGHTHRLGVHYFGNARGHSHVSASLGWLGDASQADYMHKIKASRDWHLGFGTAIEERNGTVHLQAVPIVDYKACVFGELVK